MTNGDRIRQMTDEQIAGLLHCGECAYRNSDAETCERYDCKEGILKWLKQEVYDDEQTAKGGADDD